MKLALLVLFAVGCSGCPQPGPPPPNPPVVPIVFDAAADDGSLTCSGYCGHLAALHCDAALPTREGSSCEAVCTNIQDSGILAMDLDCRVHASDCNAVDACK